MIGIRRSLYSLRQLEKTSSYTYKKTVGLSARTVHCTILNNNKESSSQETIVDIKEENDISKLLDEAVLCNNPEPVSPEDTWATSPYPEGAVLHRDQSKHIQRPKIDPKDTSVILFPGQGTQFVGMGKDLLRFPIAYDLFDAANDLLGYDLKKLCFDGPKSELDKTVHCQPAVMVCSLAAIEKLREERPRAIESCIATAGFSIGEITALVFAGALSFEEG